MIYFVRQGETDWNLNKKFNGCTDINDRFAEINCGEFEGWLK